MVRCWLDARWNTKFKIDATVWFRLDWKFQLNRCMTDAGIATKYTICTTCSTDKWCFSATKPISSKDLWISANLWMWSLSSFHIIFVYLSCIFICMEQINIYPWFLRIWTLISSYVIFERMNPDLQIVQKKCVSRHFLAQVYFTTSQTLMTIGG